MFWYHNYCGAEEEIGVENSESIREVEFISLLFPQPFPCKIYFLSPLICNLPSRPIKISFLCLLHRNEIRKEGHFQQMVNTYHISQLIVPSFLSLVENMFLK